MQIDKCAIVVDTNIIDIKKINDYSTIRWNSKIINIINWISIYHLRNKLKIVFPDVVISEYIQHLKEEYDKDCSILSELRNKNIPGIIIGLNDACFDYRKYANNEIKELINKEENCFCDMPAPVKLDRILERALNKRPPFYGKEKQSDKGFKDAVIWESILLYKETHLEETIVLYSNDKMFDNIELKEEYENRFNESINIINEEVGLIEYLKTVYSELDDTLYAQYKKTSAFLKTDECRKKVNMLFENHLSSGVWGDLWREPHVESMRLVDWYRVAYEESPAIIYEAVYKAVFKVDSGDPIDKHTLYFYIDIDDNFGLSVQGSDFQGDLRYLW